MNFLCLVASGPHVWSLLWLPCLVSRLDPLKEEVPNDQTEVPQPLGRIGQMGSERGGLAQHGFFNGRIISLELTSQEWACKQPKCMIMCVSERGIYSEHGNYIAFLFNAHEGPVALKDPRSPPGRRPQALWCRNMSGTPRSRAKTSRHPMIAVKCEGLRYQTGEGFGSSRLNTGKIR